MEAAKAALPYEKPRLASIENKIVDEFDTMTDEQIEAWLDERAEARVKMRYPAGPEAQRHNGGIGSGGAAAQRRHRALRPTTTGRGKPH